MNTSSKPESLVTSVLQTASTLAAFLASYGGGTSVVMDTSTFKPSMAGLTTTRLMEHMDTSVVATMPRQTGNTEANGTQLVERTPVAADGICASLTAEDTVVQATTGALSMTPPPLITVVPMSGGDIESESDSSGGSGCGNIFTWLQELRYDTVVAWLTEGLGARSAAVSELLRSERAHVPLLYLDTRNRLKAAASGYGAVPTRAEVDSMLVRALLLLLRVRQDADACRLCIGTSCEAAFGAFLTKVSDWVLSLAAYVPAADWPSLEAVSDAVQTALPSPSTLPPPVWLTAFTVTYRATFTFGTPTPEKMESARGNAKIELVRRETAVHVVQVIRRAGRWTALLGAGGLLAATGRRLDPRAVSFSLFTTTTATIQPPPSSKSKHQVALANSNKKGTVKHSESSSDGSENHDDTDDSD